MQNIILIGFMGSGKTTVGKALADHFGMPFLDTDTLIEQKEGRTIVQIFEEEGEAYFRKLENDLLKTISIEKTILATGGGMPCNDQNILLLKELGKVIYLELDLPDLVNRILKDNSSRPLVKQSDKEALHSDLLQKFNNRQFFYTQAHIKTDGSQKITAIVQGIKKQLA